jgi:hypothetical protein
MDLADPPTEMLGERWFPDASGGAVEVSFVDGPADRPEEVWGFAVPGDLDPQETARELLDATNPPDHPIPFAVSTRRRDCSWAAEESGWSVGLTIAVTAIAPATMTVELLTELIRQRGRRDPRRLSLPEARERAGLVTAGRYGGRPDDYQIDEERPAADGWAVDLRGPTDDRYTVDLGLQPELPGVYRIRRQPGRAGAPGAARV